MKNKYLSFLKVGQIFSVQKNLSDYFSNNN